MELAKQRVKERVSKGGHNIETEVIERRYHAGLKNFIHLYMSNCDLWLFVDNSAKNFQLNEIASGEFDEVNSIINNDIWIKILEDYDKF